MVTSLDGSVGGVGLMDGDACTETVTIAVEKQPQFMDNVYIHIYMHVLYVQYMYKTSKMMTQVK